MSHRALNRIRPQPVLGAREDHLRAYAWRQCSLQLCCFSPLEQIARICRNLSKRDLPRSADCPAHPLRTVVHLFRFMTLKAKRRGVEMRLIVNGGDEPRTPDPALLKAFARARGWFDELASGHVRSLVEIARREGVAKHYVTRLTKLAFASPAFVEAIA
jgi:hypothetical protein